MRFARLGLLFLLGVLVAFLCKAEPQAERITHSIATAASAGDFRGAGSCSAVACHGSIAPRDGTAVLGNEHTTWVSDDRHSRAYQTLFGPRSERIVRNLASNGTPSQPADRDERCLACHTTPRRADSVPATRWTNQDGVGCESCHGASGRWLGPHTTEEWQLTNGPSRKEAFGFVDTKSLASRARVCAGCHVGASSASGLLLRDVNHDLIAAGHPRLNFEFSAYLDNMPPHWNEKGQNADPAARLQRAANFPARAWAIGQFVTALASLELLEARAESGNTPWPEFSEYGCFSCHHDLRDAAWRQKRTSEPYRSSLAWGSWPMPMTRELASRFIADSAAQRFSESVQQLADFMAQPLPEQSAVRTRARQAAERLNPCLETIAARPLDEHDVATLLGIVNRREAWEGISSWDEAVQRYLALVPLYQAQLSLDPVRAPERRDLRRQIDRLFEKLRFEPGVDSPSGFDPGLLPVGR